MFRKYVATLRELLRGAVILSVITILLCAYVVLMFFTMRLDVAIFNAGYWPIGAIVFILMVLSFIAFIALVIVIGDSQVG